MITNTTRGWVTRMQAVCLSLLCAFALLGLGGHALAQDPPTATPTVPVAATGDALVEAEVATEAPAFDSGNVAWMLTST